ncbi:MAG: DUF4129 domain-containing protein [Candidatus Methanosuratincola sp.]
MRQSAKFTLMTAGVVAAVLTGAFLLPGPPSPERHTDAGSVQSELPSALALVSVYSTAFSSILQGGYANASELIAYINSSYVPENVRYVFARFNSLLDSAVQDLNRTEIMIDACWDAIRVGQTQQAREAAVNASISLWRANTTAGQVREASSAIASQLKAQQIRGLIASLDQRIAYLSGELSDALGELERVESGTATATSINLSISPGRAWVGAPVEARGVLVDGNGSPVEGAAVHLVVGGARYTTVTGSGGDYSVSFSAPFVYVAKVPVYAYFAATGDLAGSRSPDVQLELLWIQPGLTIWLNATRVLPGGGLMVAGSTGLGSDLDLEYSLQKVRVTAFGSSYEVLAEGGSFSVEVPVPYSARAGNHSVIADLVPSGVVGPDTASSWVEVYRTPTTISVEAPPIAVAGTAVKVTGVLVDENGVGLPGASVLVSMPSSAGGETVRALTGEWGRFEAEVTIPLATPTGPLELGVSGEPGEGIYAPSRTSLSVYSINPSVLAVAGAASALLFSTVVPKIGKGKGRTMAAFAAQTTLEPGSGISVRSGMRPVVSAYQRAAAAVGNAVGSAIRRSETLREFLGRSRGSIGEASGPFSELTSMAEEELYGGRAHDPKKAESLADRVVSALSRVFGWISGKVDGAVARGSGGDREEGGR